MIGPKADLPAGGDSFETATPLIPCVYKGMFDTQNDQFLYYKLAVPRGRTLQVMMRTRDTNSASVAIRLHGPNGGMLGGYTAYGDSSVTNPLTYKADEAGSVFLSLGGGLRDSAIEISLHQ